MVTIDLWEDDELSPSIEDELNQMEESALAKNDNFRMIRPDSGFQDEDTPSIEKEMEMLASIRRTDRFL